MTSEERVGYAMKQANRHRLKGVRRPSPSFHSDVHLEMQDTPPSSSWTTRKPIVGTWLSLVERTLGVGEVASSNLVVPTIFQIAPFEDHVEGLSVCRRYTYGVCRAVQNSILSNLAFSVEPCEMYSEYALFASSKILCASRARSPVSALFKPSIAILTCCSSIRQSLILRSQKSSGILPSSLSV
jgi:hypothetical protein